MEHYMPELNPALFDPLTRIENACRRASNIMLTAVDPTTRQRDGSARNPGNPRSA